MIQRRFGDRLDRFNQALAAALAGYADAIITSDEHLLAVHPYEGIPILRPVDFWGRVANRLK